MRVGTPEKTRSRSLFVVANLLVLDQNLLGAWKGPGPWNGPVPMVSCGGCAEVGYDLLHWWAPGSSQELDVFDRFDAVDTQAAVPQGFAAVVDDRRYSKGAALPRRRQGLRHLRGLVARGLVAVARKPA